MGLSLRKLLPTPRHSKTGLKGNQSILIHTASLLTKISNVGPMLREADEQKTVEAEQAPELITGATAENSSLTSICWKAFGFVLSFLPTKSFCEWPHSTLHFYIMHRGFNSKSPPWSATPRHRSTCLCPQHRDYRCRLPHLAGFLIFKFHFMCLDILVTYISVYQVSTWCPPKETRGRHQIPLNWSHRWLGATMRVLWIEPEFSERAIGFPSPRDNPPAPTPGFFTWVLEIKTWVFTLAQYYFTH